MYRTEIGHVPSHLSCLVSSIWMEPDLRFTEQSLFSVLSPCWWLHPRYSTQSISSWSKSAVVSPPQMECWRVTTYMLPLSSSTPRHLSHEPSLPCKDTYWDVGGHSSLKSFVNTLYLSREPFFILPSALPAELNVKPLCVRMSCDYFKL